MTLAERQRWMFRLSIAVGALAAIPALAFFTGRVLPIGLLLAVVLALLLAGAAALALGFQHMRALRHHRRHQR